MHSIMKLPKSKTMKFVYFSLFVYISMSLLYALYRYNYLNEGIMDFDEVIVSSFLQLSPTLLLFMYFAIRIYHNKRDK